VNCSSESIVVDPIVTRGELALPREPLALDPFGVATARWDEEEIRTRQRLESAEGRDARV
jgi:hypothetical protein